mgnify:CR=1 FL=1
MKKTRKLAGIMVAAVLAAGLAGCGSGQTAATQAQTEAAKTTEAPKAGEPAKEETAKEVLASEGETGAQMAELPEHYKMAAVKASEEPIEIKFCYYSNNPFWDLIKAGLNDDKLSGKLQLYGHSGGYGLGGGWQNHC